MTKPKIAVVTGGTSSELEISLQSAKIINENLDKNKFDTYIVVLEAQNWYVVENNTHLPIDKNDFSYTNDKDEKIVPDCVFTAIHGTPGEDGKLQGYFDLLSIPYTNGGVLSSSLTFHKFACKNYMKPFEVVKMANDIELIKGQEIDIDKIIATVGLPCFVKPSLSGSSCGISKVKQKSELQDAINKAFVESNDVIIEQFIQGIELTSGVLKTKNATVLLPVTEVVSHKEFFDYEAKYNASLSDEITPARISEADTLRCQQTSSKIYDILKCSGVVRVDYILSGNDLYFLEINTVPGMAANSIIPKQVRTAGLKLTDFYTQMIEDKLV